MWRRIAIGWPISDACQNERASAINCRTAAKLRMLFPFRHGLCSGADNSRRWSRATAADEFEVFAEKVNRLPRRADNALNRDDIPAIKREQTVL